MPGSRRLRSSCQDIRGPSSSIHHSHAVPPLAGKTIATMLGIDYASSDEDEASQVATPNVSLIDTLKGSIATNIKLTTKTQAPPVVNQAKAAAPAQAAITSVPVEDLSQGPTVSLPLTEEAAQDAAPGSPYTTSRVLIQNLTLPTVPNFSIPPSPPGSPSQKATKKFAQFLDLKKKDQHFNQRLETSSVLRDPSHLQRLMDFAGINEEDSYTSTLSRDVAVPSKFPEWAYFEELRASQKEIAKKKAEDRSKGPREAVEFVAATRSGTSSGTGTPAAKGSRQSATERVMAGLSKDSASSGKRKELEHRSRDNSSSAGRRRSRSRSPKRRRSRSGEGRRG